MTQPPQWIPGKNLPAVHRGEGGRLGHVGWLMVGNMLWQVRDLELEVRRALAKALSQGKSSPALSPSSLVAQLTRVSA